MHSAPTAWVAATQQGIALDRCYPASPWIQQEPPTLPLLGLRALSTALVPALRQLAPVSAFPRWAHPEVELLVCLALKRMPLPAGFIGATLGIDSCGPVVAGAQFSPTVLLMRRAFEGFLVLSKMHIDDVARDIEHLGNARDGLTNFEDSLVA